MDIGTSGLTTNGAFFEEITKKVFPNGLGLLEHEDGVAQRAVRVERR
jgi:hypothetical protein